MNYEKNIGKRVCKCSITTQVPNHKPFKSTFLTNTVKGVITHPILNIPAYTFEEDDSYVECRRCVVMVNSNHQNVLLEIANKDPERHKELIFDILSKPNNK